MMNVIIRCLNWPGIIMCLWQYATGDKRLLLNLRYAHPLTVDEVTADFPDVQFVICHCGNPWLTQLRRRENDNVAVDLSGLLEEYRGRIIGRIRVILIIWVCGRVI